MNSQQELQQKQHQWVAQVNGKAYAWTPRPGMDPSVGEQGMRIAAAAYASAKAAGKPEVIAQQEAERAAFKHQYRVVYAD
jgi:hypothetical protein